MEERTIAMQVGARLRRARQALGLSQEELAGKLYITPQAISKYEKNGVSDIDIITKLSNVLGHDLLSEEIDEEGEVGEIGKEILSQLVEHYGYMTFSELSKEFMYGMNDARVSKEIFKLEKIGLCVREQYHKWNNDIIDGLFITAKGVISYKNFTSKDAFQVSLCLKDVLTYEMLLGDCESYQDYLDKHPEINLIRHLTDIMDAHRVDYINYLFSCHIPHIGMERSWKLDKRTPATAYYDIALKTALGLDNETEYYVEKIIEEGEDDLYLEPVHIVAYDKLYEDYPKAKKFIKEYEDSFGGYGHSEWESQVSKMKNYSEYVQAAYDMELSEHDEPDPFGWFNLEDIRVYIEANMGKAITESAMEIDMLCKELNTIMPETLNYYVFPSDWEEAGIADMIRETYGIEKAEVVNKLG